MHSHADWLKMSKKFEMILGNKCTFTTLSPIDTDPRTAIGKMYAHICIHLLRNTQESDLHETHVTMRLFPMMISFRLG